MPISRPRWNLGLCFGAALAAWAVGAKTTANAAGSAYPAVSALVAAQAADAAQPSLAAVAAKSGLPYLRGSDIWWDSRGIPTSAVPGVDAPAIRTASILIFRPQGDTLSWEQFTALYVEQGLLPRAPKADLTVSSAPQGNLADVTVVANAEETNVYTTQSAGELLLLGQIRNLRSRNQLAYAVRLSGKLTNAEAVVQVRKLVDALAAEAKNLRTRLLAPPGAVPAAPEATLRGAYLGQLMRSIEQSLLLSPRVKSMTRAILAQATAVTVSSWRTRSVVSDAAFFQYYTQQAEKLGWGAPVMKDETQPGRPAMLFQRPNNQGVVMVRAQPAPLVGPSGPVPRRTTILFRLEVEGAINAGAFSGG